MPSISIEGDFISGFTEFLDWMLTADSGSFQNGLIRFSETQSGTPIELFNARFSGSFNTTTSSGNITKIETDYTRVELGNTHSPWDFELTDVAVFFPLVFQLSGGTYSYNERFLISGLAGNDWTVTGSDENDKVGGSDYFAFSGTDIFHTEGGNDLVKAGLGNDTVNGGAGRDKLFGEGGHDTLNGNGGNDRLFGQSGDDILSGGGGQDRLKGQSGADVLKGGGGFDILTGGPGRDTFYFGSDRKTDHVTDFQNRKDKIAVQNADSFADLDITTKGDDVLLTDGSLSLLLLDTAIDKIDASDFIF